MTSRQMCSFDRLVRIMAHSFRGGELPDEGVDGLPGIGEQGDRGDNGAVAPCVQLIKR